MAPAQNTPRNWGKPVAIIGVPASAIGALGFGLYANQSDNKNLDRLEARVSNIEIRAREDHDLLVDLSADVRWIRRSIEEKK